MMSSSELLEMLKKEHMFFLPKRTLSCFCSFLSSYDFAYGERGIKAPDRDFFFFSSWLIKEYMVTESIGWYMIIQRLSDNNDEVAFDVFYEKWNEFKKIPQEDLNKDFVDENGNRVHWTTINIKRMRDGEIPPDQRVSGPLVCSTDSNTTENE